MEGFNRFTRNLNLNRGTRDNTQDRMRADREFAERRRMMMQNSVSIEQIKEAVNDSNDSQLDAIQDMFYDEHIDREAAEKEVLRAVDSNAKLLNKNYRLLNEIKDDMDSDDIVDLKNLSEENKEEILKAVLSNTEILNLLKQSLIDEKVEEYRDWEDNIFDKASAEKAFIDLEDLVHKENVKCFRNVKEAVEETDEKTYSNIKKGLNTLKALIAITLVFGIANLAFLLCWFFRII